MARTTPGLTDEQVAKLRTAVAGPRKPRVTLLDTQFGADATGQVVAVGDPAADGDDFITVRVKLGGVVDTLTFGPAELAMPTRGRTTKPAAAPAKREAAKRESTTAPKPVSRRTSAASSPPASSPPAASPPAPAQAASAPAPSAPAPSAPAPSAPAASKATAGPTTPAKPRRAAAGRRRSPAPVTVTVSSAGNSWKLTAMRSGRSLVRATTLAPGVVSAVADLLGDEALQQAVAEINDVSLIEAQERAQQLRDELAQVESVLQAHQRPNGKYRP